MALFEKYRLAQDSSRRAHFGPASEVRKIDPADYLTEKNKI
jgi:hypothetical protein